MHAFSMCDALQLKCADKDMMDDDCTATKKKNEEELTRQKCVWNSCAHGMFIYAIYVYYKGTLIIAGAVLSARFACAITWDSLRWRGSFIFFIK